MATSYNPMNLSYGNQNPIDMNSFSYSMPQSAAMPVASPTTSMGSPMASPMTPAPMPAGSGVQPAAAPAVQPMQAMPAAGSAQQSFGNSLIWNGTGEDRSLNYQGLGLISQGISTLGSLYNSWQQNKLARESLELQRDSYETNLENQTQTYNNSLEDRIRGRYTRSQQDDPAIQQTIDERRL